MNPWTTAADQRSIATLRSLSIDQVQAARSGHPGLPLAMAPVVHTLFSRFVLADPEDPSWINRDRFVLSAGHGSALLYSVLHLAGYDLSLEDLQAFRQWGSATPGHPEHGVTPGVDATTGPLGQGLANAVGMAIAEQHAAERLNTPRGHVIDHRTWVLASDGDLMEGVALEAMALAGVQKLGKLIVLYDDNDIVIDGRASSVHSAAAACEAARAYGWQVSDAVEADDLVAVESAIHAALGDEQHPSLIRIRSTIGAGSRIADTSAIHSGALPEAEAQRLKSGYDSGLDTAFAVPDDVREAWSAFAERGAQGRSAWEDERRHQASDSPERSERLERWLAGRLNGVDESSVEPPQARPLRAIGGAVLADVAGRNDQIIGGAADLASATMAKVPDGGQFSPENRGGRNIAFGVREHAMGAITNGIALHGLLRPFASTFLVFSTYEANALRMAALQELPVIHVFSHDSLTVGEDGPTHQPVEQLATLRMTPNTHVLRPADTIETISCWNHALRRTGGPSVFAMGRTAVPELEHSAQLGDPSCGGYVLEPSLQGEPEICLVSSGSEVHLAVEAARILRADGLAVQVVSMPSWNLFAEQPAAYRQMVLREDLPRLVIEASHPAALVQMAGPLGAVHGLETFGASAPPERVLAEFGFTPQAIVEAARSHLGALGSHHSCGPKDEAASIPVSG